MANEYMWRKTFGDTRPDARKAIIILTDEGRVMRGYMNSTVWPGETKTTYSFHGEYFDFQTGKIAYCLINALGWMPMPELPKVRSQIEEQRLRELEQPERISE